VLVATGHLLEEVLQRGSPGVARGDGSLAGLGAGSAWPGERHRRTFRP
jgi:hypothetical protein